MTTVPVDILEHVVDILAADDDQISIKAFSLVCHSVLHFCRKHIFKTIIIDTNAAHVKNQPENAVVLPKWKGDPKDEHTKDLVGLIPFLDMAYQGFSEGLEEDGLTVRKFAARVGSFVVCTSFSKSLSLYGERVGALSIVCADAEEAKRVTSQVKIVIRTTYSNPPTHGASVVATVLGDAALRAQFGGHAVKKKGR